MKEAESLEKLRPLGKLEQLSGACHHLGFYHNVGLSARYSAPTTTQIQNLRNLIFVALQDVIRQHGILSAIPVKEHSPEAYFARLPSIDLTRSVTFITRSKPETVDGQDSELDAILEEQHNLNFKDNYGSLPFWRLLILQEAGREDRFSASFIFHHSIGDGMAGLIFHKYFERALRAARAASEPISASITTVNVKDNIELLPPLEELHPLPIQNEATPAPSAEKAKEWTGGRIQTPCVTRYRTLYLSPISTNALIQKGKQNGLSLTSLLSAIIAAALFDVLPPPIDVLTGIIPVNLRPWLDLPRELAHDAMGTFIDAFRVQINQSELYTDGSAEFSMLSVAQKVSKEITRRLRDNLSPSGEPYTNVAIFKTVPDVAQVFSSAIGKERDAGFEVSNLGQFSGFDKEPVKTSWRVGRMTFSRSSVVSGSAVTMSAVSGGDNALTVGFSWQDNVVEDGLVRNLVVRVKELAEHLSG
ncbi:alcohol acetyltransferase [Boeremia exigua]|uniref:alcohol acetyltransferase n=1 Tax=Boeremia exigua TaxID=749465 RepID=UPI001E8E3C96|nr:alcohol acetyltransferase [Boeremia exigua]KAH6629307.1 alcohol acetyltransferase [Boeremia exigua]